MSEISSTEKKWALAATIIGSGMAFINGSVVNVALPAIQSSLDATVADMQWVVSIYTFILGTLILTGGSAGDYYGRKRVFGLGVFVFLLSTVWCGLAPDVIQLIIARGGQAIGGAMMIPGSLAIITDLYEKEQRGKAIGTWSGFTALATATGPLMGGILVDQFSWRFIFLISVPMAIAALAILYFRVPESKVKANEGQPDWKGALLATLGLGLICYGLIEASEFGIYNPVVLITGGLGIIIFCAFIWLEKNIENPMVRLGMFRSMSFSGANLVTLFFYFSLAGVFFLLPFNLIQVQGYSATAAGAAFIPFPLLVGGLSRWSGGMIVRFGARPMLMAGPIITSLGFLLLGLYGTGSNYWFCFFPGISLMGLGVAVSFAPMNTTVMSSVDKSDAGSASGVNKAVARLSGMLSVALLGALAITLFGNELSVTMQQNDVPQTIQQQLMQEKANLATASVPDHVPSEMKNTLQNTIKQSFLISFQTVMFISAGLVLMGAVCAGLMVSYKPESADLIRQNRAV
ncbi:MFS transporter [Balneolaceae bacterium YR4-1]|uniref:MFS transporter n=1 Tax=Halalkalibaculum roseum TaxID=2709311 RepID=A0A6M1SVK1_9BACT|nr:MFS transporter [Halalkalibaculum roseum]NGP76892.1 MFS transporter [Halalkalibaculum roseum]